MKIAIFDDNEIMAHTLMEYFLESNHELSYAKDYKGAMLITLAIKPDLMIIDPWFVPDGEVISKIIDRKITKVLCISTNIKSCKYLEADYFLSKPFDLIDLEKIVEEVENSI